MEGEITGLHMKNLRLKKSGDKTAWQI